VTLWFGTDVYAQGGGPCSGDVAKFCKDVQRVGGRIAPSTLSSGALLDSLVAFRENWTFQV
jgi:hypothetical protein